MIFYDFWEKADKNVSNVVIFNFKYFEASQ